MSTQPIVTVTLDTEFGFQDWSESLLSSVNKLASSTQAAVINTGLDVALRLRGLGERVRVTGILPESSRAASNALFGENRLDNHYYYESCPSVCESTWGSFRKGLEDLCETSEWFVVSGHAPKGLSPRISGQITAILKHKGRRVIVDTRGLALKAAIEARPDVVKTDLQQLENWAGHALTTPAEQHEAVRQLIFKGVRNVILESDVKVQWFNPEQAWEARITSTNAPNAEGLSTAPDSLLAGIAHGLANKQPITEILSQSIQASLTPDRAVLNPAAGNGGPQISLKTLPFTL